MRKTKLSCTLGPASSDIILIEEMMKLGMDSVRLNLSHGTYSSHSEYIRKIKECREKLGLSIPIIMDTKGPEYRTGIIESGEINIDDNSEFIFSCENEARENKNIVGVSYLNLYKDIKPKDNIFVDNRKLEFEVLRIDGCKIITKTVHGGKLSSKKSMCFPNSIMEHDNYLSETDKKDILFCINECVDYILCSFVSRKEDVKMVRDFLDKNGGKNIKIIAKIESLSGIKNVDEISSLCDTMVLGRGDLGNELSYEKIPKVQNDFIKKCKELGVKLIIATELYETMEYNIRPSRAEVDDVYNLVQNGVYGVMLTGETAEGKYPIESIKSIISVINESEKNL